jgi:hypothetical protein
MLAEVTRTIGRCAFTLGAALAACTGNASAPAEPSAPLANKDGTVMEKLNEVVAKAASNPDAYPDLEIVYERGHELSGTIRFTARATGAYTLASNVTMGRTPGTWSGQLSARQRQAVLDLVANHKIVQLASSTRNIGDDEEPVALTVRQGGMSHTTRLWHDDAARSAQFHPFEAGLLALLKELSGGAIVATAT